MKKEYIHHDGVVYEKMENSYWRGYVPVRGIAQQNPTIQWLGPPIPINLLIQVKAFLLWAYRKHAAEALVWLYIVEHRDNARSWLAVAPPQEGTGANVEVDEKAIKKNGLPELDLKDGVPVMSGSIHSHCSMAAGQSSTDHHSEVEKQRVGLHLTLGELDKDTWDLHGRVVYGGTQFYVSWNDWITFPYEGSKLPAPVRENAIQFFLTSPSLPTDNFPDIWEERFSEARTFGYGHYDERESIREIAAREKAARTRAGRREAAIEKQEELDEERDVLDGWGNMMNVGGGLYD